MDTEQMNDAEFEKYKMLKDRINELERKIEFYEGEIPIRMIREKIHATKLTLQANTEMLKFLFGEGCLRQ